MHRVLVAGLGNVLMSDDAIGPFCIQQLLACYHFPAHVAVEDLGTPGLDLALHLSSADVVVAVDALRGVEPGSVHVFDRSALLSGGHENRLDTHAPALEESLLIAQLAGDRPADVRLVGLGGATFEHGTRLSPIVRATMAPLCERVLLELTTLGVEWHPRQQCDRPDIWWEDDSIEGTDQRPDPVRHQRGDLCGS
jgi:hydrogenase maturation protease